MRGLLVCGGGCSLTRTTLREKYPDNGNLQGFFEKEVKFANYIRVKPDVTSGLTPKFPKIKTGNFLSYFNEFMPDKGDKIS